MIGERSSGIWFSVDVFRVLLERHSSAIGHCKCCGSIGVRFGCVSEWDSWMCVVFSGVISVRVDLVERTSVCSCKTTVLSV